MPTCNLGRVLVLTYRLAMTKFVYHATVSLDNSTCKGNIRLVAVLAFILWRPCDTLFKLPETQFWKLRCCQAFLVTIQAPILISRSFIHDLGSEGIQLRVEASWSFVLQGLRV